MPPAKKATQSAKAAVSKTAAPPKQSTTAKKTVPAAKTAALTAKQAAAAAKTPGTPKKAAAAATKASPMKAAPQVTVTLKQMAATLAESHDLQKKQAEAVLGDLVMLATQHLKKGDKIRLTGLGILQVKDRPARMGRNPATGEAVQLAASKKIAFRPAKELKEAV